MDLLLDKSILFMKVCNFLFCDVLRNKIRQILDFKVKRGCVFNIFDPLSLGNNNDQLLLPQFPNSTLPNGGLQLLIGIPPS
jgi:hypothetical protein